MSGFIFFVALLGNTFPNLPFFSPTIFLSPPSLFYFHYTDHEAFHASSLNYNQTLEYIFQFLKQKCSPGKKNAEEALLNGFCVYLILFFDWGVCVCVCLEVWRGEWGNGTESWFSAE